MSPISQTLPESLFGSIHLLKFLPVATAMALSSAAPTFLLEYFCRWTSAGCMLTCRFPLPVCACHPPVSLHGLHGVPAQGDLLPHQCTHARGPTTAPLASTHAWSHCYPAVMQPLVTINASLVSSGNLRMESFIKWTHFKSEGPLSSNLRQEELNMKFCLNKVIESIGTNLQNQILNLHFCLPV